MRHRKVLTWIIGGLLAVFVLIYLRSNERLTRRFSFEEQPPVRVGVLHSLSGTMAISEKSVVDATLLAIDGINQQGGLLGMKIVPVLADGKSDPDIFAREAERLIVKEGVKVIFGCWTSASRKAVKPVVEKHNSLLFYPVQYEGLEESPNIIYMGAAPNQQLIPAVTWALDHLGKRVFLVGSDYVFPRVANEIARSVIGYLGGEIVGEEYVLLGGQDFSAITAKIKATRPDVVLNTINGDSNLALFEALHQQRIRSSEVPVMSLSITESETRALRDLFSTKHPQEAAHFLTDHLAGTYACWNYFESIDSPLNKEFVERFRSKGGKRCAVTDPMEAAYVGVNLWAQAVNESGCVDDSRALRNALRHLSVAAPEGIITVANNNHARKTIRIGKVNESGGFDIVWSSKKPMEPAPYPAFREKAAWDDLLNGLHQKWGGHWDARNAPAGVEAKP